MILILILFSVFVIFLISLIFFMRMETQTSNPIKQDQGSAQDFFLYLVTFLSLGFVAFGEGNILYGFINKFIADKDANVFPMFDQGMVKFGIAAIIIAGPIYFVVSRIITKRISEQKIGLESKVRKWLTYIVLFFAAATIIGDLITLVVNFLSGEFTASFLLKVLVILLIAGSIFGYYFWDMRRTQIASAVNKFAMIACMAVVTLTFVAGFFIIDSPEVSRQKNIDQQTINNLQSIDSSVQNYFSETGKLPQKLEDLQTTKFSFGIQNIGLIEYKIEGEEKYQLCTNFQRSSFDDVKSANRPFIEDWNHDAGNFCFPRTVLKKDVNTPEISR